jgi:hypothetical protein
VVLLSPPLLLLHEGLLGNLPVRLSASFFEEAERVVKHLQAFALKFATLLVVCWLALG